MTTKKEYQKVIRLGCIDCCNGSYKAIRLCTDKKCPSWSFRMGTDPSPSKRGFAITKLRDKSPSNTKTVNLSPAPNGGCKDENSSVEAPTQGQTTSVTVANNPSTEVSKNLDVYTQDFSRDVSGEEKDGGGTDV